MSPKLLIINKEQFGYLTDAYYWCKYLRDEYEISFICFDTGKKKIQLGGIKIHYVKYIGNKTFRGLLFITIALLNILFFNGKIIIEYFEHCEILKKIFPYKKMIVDVRTLSVSENECERNKRNGALIESCRYFDKVTAISNGVKNKIGLDNISVLPLGADPISTVKKDYTKLRLLYVGTFSGRQLEKTILGCDIFHKANPDVHFSYEIIGFGFNNEENELKKLVTDLKLDKYIIFRGKIPNIELKPYFDRNNFGISFIPITDYYNYQPPTKTFEYALSGLFVIATATYANQEVISQDNGILINDTAESFAQALNQINHMAINEDNVRKSMQQYAWKLIVENILKPILS